MLEELLTGEVGLLNALLGEFAHHLGLGSNGGMVGAGYPAGILTLHPRAADEDVLNGVVKHVTHVQHTGDVGWGDNHRIRLSAIGFGTEKLVVKPVLIPFRLNFLRVVLTC